VLLVLSKRPHSLPTFAHHDRGAGVLAHRQNATGGDVRVLQQIEGDEAIVRASFRVNEDRCQLRQMRGAK
jgi:hypothetical protein